MPTNVHAVTIMSTFNGWGEASAGAWTPPLNWKKKSTLRNLHFKLDQIILCANYVTLLEKYT